MTTETTLYIILIVLAVLDFLLICLDIYLYFVIARLVELAEQIQRRIEMEKQLKIFKISTYTTDENIPIYVLDEDDSGSRKRYAPQFEIQNISKDEGYIFYRTNDVKFRKPSEKEFRAHIKNVIETKLAIDDI